ncbi:MAG TPA: DoxX family protein [Gaiellaceae bacterium]
MGIGRLFVRGAIGSLMVGHGTQKLFGWFGGGGPEGTGQFFEQVGLRPGRRNALAAGAAEAGGGMLLALGLATPLAVAALQGVMLSAIRHVHWQNGPWVTKGGYEYNLVLIAALFGLAEAGPGRLSLDAARDKERAGLGWALAALAGAAAASYGISAAAEAAEVEAEATPREQAAETSSAVEAM